MKKLPISKFDLGFIIAFVVVTLLGFGAYWYFSGDLKTAQDEVAAAKSSFDKNSKNTKYNLSVNTLNLKFLKDNNEILKSELDKIIPDKLQSKDSKLRGIEKVDPIQWKHDLDDKVRHLTAAAKQKPVGLPANFYFGFSRYLSQSPNDEQTGVLGKQLVAIDELAGILINAPVKSITSIRRTFEEDPRPANANANNNQMSPMMGSSTEPDRLLGFSTSGPGNEYVSYPFDLEFVTTAEDLRKILDDLLKSPYVFVVRAITVKNSYPQSPRTTDLAAMAGGGQQGESTVTGSSPGEVASTPKLPPQFIFGEKDSTIKVKAQVDMIDWKGAQ